MNDLDTYLRHNYKNTEQLAAACSISPDELANLVSEKLAPEPSYTVTDWGEFISQAFGKFQAPGSTPGQYYHPANTVWIALAMEARRKVGPLEAHRELKERFRSNFAAAL
ncbi:MAG TPA: hypothetical protein VGV14_07115, partial [Rhodanobacter sp.]|nr:hypothetical protein [Rhodanobacter sp.]